MRRSTLSLPSSFVFASFSFFAVIGCWSETSSAWSPLSITRQSLLANSYRPRARQQSNNVQHQPFARLSASQVSTLDGSSDNDSLFTSESGQTESVGTSVDWDWKALAYKVFEKDQTPILLFDGLCNFCNGGVNLCLDLDQPLSKQTNNHQPLATTTTTTKTYTYRYASLQSRVGQSLLLQHNKAPDDWSSLVLVKSPHEAYFRSDAVLQIGQGLPGLPPPVRWLSQLTRTVVPKPLRDMLYEIVASQRYRIAGHAAGASCRMDWDGTLQQRFVPDPEEDQLQKFKITCTTTEMSAAGK